MQVKRPRPSRDEDRERTVCTGLRADKHAPQGSATLAIIILDSMSLESHTFNQEKFPMLVMRRLAMWFITLWGRNSLPFG